MAVQRVDRTPRQRVVFGEEIGKDFFFGEAAVEKHGNGPRNELAHLAIGEEQGGHRFASILAVEHELARVDQVVDFRYRDAEHFGDRGQGQQFFASEEIIKSIHGP